MRKLFLGLFLALSSILVSFAQSGHNFETAKQMDIFTSILRELDEFYVDSLNSEKIVRVGIDAMLNGLDPYTEYYSEADMGDLKLLTTGKYAGIGSVIRAYNKDKVIVFEPYFGSPAQKSGLKVGDILLEIDGKSLEGKSVSDVSSMLRGEPATTFELKVKRFGVAKPLSFRITRETISTPAIPYYGMVSDKVGFIRLSQFTENCAQQFRKDFLELRAKGAEKLIIDLRDNGGGLLSEAVDIVNLFVPKQTTIVQTRGKAPSTSTEYVTHNEPIDTDIPLAVLVNGNTASASEILSGSLQDLDRGVIIGARTFGKGLVQSPRDLPYNGSIKLTTAKYYIPSGRCIQAIDYSNRDAYGKAERIADSLTHVFYTKAGREVRDGGGIRPDEEVKVDTVANITAYLSYSDQIVDFGNEYMQSHPVIAPAGEFEITDEDFEAFRKMVLASDFKYDEQTSGALKKLRQIAGFEGYLDQARDEFDALEKKLVHNMSYDLDKNREDIKLLLAGEILKRAYFQGGVIEHSLRSDKVTERAISILNDEEKYHSFLSVAPKDAKEKK